MKAGHEELMVIMQAGQEKIEAMTVTCLEKAVTMGLVQIKKKNSSIWSSRSPKEEAAIVTIGALKDQYRDLHLAVGRYRQPMK
jgi:hypothetical protein